MPGVADQEVVEGGGNGTAAGKDDAAVVGIADMPEVGGGDEGEGEVGGFREGESSRGGAVRRIDGAEQSVEIGVEEAEDGRGGTGSDRGTGGSRRRSGRRCRRRRR